MKSFIRTYGLLVLIGIVSIIPFVAYIWKFHSYGISDNPEDWGVFGDYIGGYGSLIVSVLAIYASVVLQKQADKHYEHRKVLKHIYKRIDAMKFRRDVPIDQVNQLFRYINDNDLFLSRALCKDLIDYTDQLKKYGSSDISSDTAVVQCIES